MCMKPTKEDIGRRVKQVRGTLTQQSFAELLGVTRQTVADVESGRSFPTVPFLVAIATKCNICLNWLLSGEQCSAGEAPDSLSACLPENDEDAAFAHILSGLWELYTSADSDMKGWLKVQLRRAIPELDDLETDTKKQHSASAESA